MRHWIMALFLLACDGYPPDNGLKTVGGAQATPLPAPVPIVCAISPCSEVDGAIDWWHEQNGLDLFIRVPRGTPSSVPITEGDLPIDGSVLLDDNWWSGQGGYPTGMAITTYVGSVAVSAEIILQRGDWTQYTVRHELGHIAGLADDEYSIDLNSIMATPHFRWSIVTAHDRALLEAAHGY